MLNILAYSFVTQVRSKAIGRNSANPIVSIYTHFKQFLYLSYLRVV